MTCADVQKKMEKTWEHCIVIYGVERCIALCHHGSHNYECALPESDVDAKLIVAPTWSEIIKCEKPLSKTISGPYGDINVCDIRLFIDVNLKKQNFNFLETLFTPYSCVNPVYADLWDVLICNREQIAHYKPREAIRTMMGQVENQWRRWNNYDDKKTLYHMMRITSAIEHYQKGLCFADTLIPEEPDLIMEVRLGQIGQEAMEKIFRLRYDKAHFYAYGHKYEGPECPWVEQELDEILRRFVLRALYERGVE